MLFYFSEIAFIGFMLHEIKRYSFFLGHRVVDIVTFNQTLESVCDRKLTVISQQLIVRRSIKLWTYDANRILQF